ncbi:YcbX family protein [Proteus myxofaciens]|uniref:Family 1 ferredoxin-NADPH reductase n=1 Tax=Proteus myxofaciens ATCC 19692 TaxID=1354337 RepID=A0A198FDD8_9GAMM|nr:YcbX family protein [Proteus myxofaciens]OAT22882.1 family 1 ferredoxin-NADPH reductase [Proteus myxofaciens ATCC 19692]
MINVSRLYIHPVKSMKGIRLSHAFARESGFTFDRDFMITTPEGTFLTARKYPFMLRFIPSVMANGVYIQAPDGEGIAITYQDFQSSLQPTEVWGNHFTAYVAPDEINQWFSRYFDRDVQLRWTGEKSTRRVKKSPDTAVSFADGYPYLLINEASFQYLQQRCPASINIEQFRGNILITGAKPFEEDTWQTLRVGSVVMDLMKPCSRCIMTTISIDKGMKHPNTEPLATLQTFRSDEKGDVDFGQNVIIRKSGIIRVGDEIEVLAYRQAKTYLTLAPIKAQEEIKTEIGETQTINIEFNGVSFEGNNQEVLLEQLENNGHSIPYSCRAGLCGSCAIQLDEGEVNPLKAGAIKRAGKILACSCVPKGNVKLSFNKM